MQAARSSLPRAEALTALDEAICQCESSPRTKRDAVFRLAEYRGVLTRAMGAQHRAHGRAAAESWGPAGVRDYLRPIGELIGCPSPPGRSWRAEWVPLMIEWLYANGYPSLANAEYVESNNSVTTNVGDYSSEIHALVDAGWCREDAEACTLLTNDGRPGMARALREGSPIYAASTYALCDVLVEQARRQAEAHQRCGSAAPPRLYRNLQGRLGLLADDPNWLVLDREVRAA
eukprot:4792082-Prymnesium_polylepis.1